MPKLEELNKAQQEAALHKDGPCVVIAGAGSGKTAMLVIRVEQLIKRGIPPNKILCCTFTKKATQEMKERIIKCVGPRGKAVTVSTIHGLAHRMVKQKLRLGEEWKLATSTGWIYELVMAPKTSSNPYGTDTTKYMSAEEAQLEVGKFKNSKVEPKDVDDPVVREIYAAYEKFKEYRKLLDFDDLLIKADELMHADPVFCKEVQSHWQYVSVDEFQDTSLVQWELIMKLVEPHHNVLVVGDDFQSVYSFRGAKPELILQFAKFYPEAKTIILEKNYRSREPVIRASNKVIALNKNQLKKVIVAHRKGGEPIRVIPSEDEEDEAKKIIETIRSLMVAFPECKYRDFAILYRTNQQSRALEEAFLDAELPYQIVGDKHFYELPRVVTILKYMRTVNAFLNGVSPEVEWVTDIINRPKRGITKEAVQRMQQSDTGLRAMTEQPKDYEPFLNTMETLLDCLSPSEFMEKLQELHPELLQTDKGEMWGDSLKQSCSRFDTLNKFLVYVDSVIERSKDKHENGVQFMTLHSSKGLEYGTVFMLDMINGVVPYARSVDEGNEEEETRLCYVGMTRAKDRLYLCVPKTMGGNPCAVSPFVEILKNKGAKKNAANATVHH